MFAFTYKKRWDIELVFKKLKQNFQLHNFYSETVNGIKSQIWYTLIAQLLLTVLKVKTKTKKAFSTVAAVIRIHLIIHLDMYWLIESCSRTCSKKKLGGTKDLGHNYLLIFRGGRVEKNEMFRNKQRNNNKLKTKTD